MAVRTGLPMSTIITMHLCRVLTTYRPKISAQIAQGVSDGKITAAQAATLEGWLDLGGAACASMRAITGY